MFLPELDLRDEIVELQWDVAGVKLKFMLGCFNDQSRLMIVDKGVNCHKIYGKPV
jgi:hypothetical protein